MILELLSAYLLSSAPATACFQITAKVVSFDDGTAVLESYDGSRVTLALAKLPEATQKFLKANAGHTVSDCFPLDARKSSSPAPKKAKKKSTF